MPQHGTNQWILKHPAYLKWIRSDGGLLWIQGKPGSGKSTLAKSIQNHLKSISDQELLVATSTSSIVGDHFFSERHARKSTSHITMLKSLIYQILNQDHAVFETVRPYFRELGYETLKAYADHRWPLGELEQLLHCISSTKSSQIFLILDALDESDEYIEEEQANGDSGIDRSRVFSRLAQFARNRLKILALSRPSRDVHQSFKYCHKIILEDVNKGDILSIIQTGLGSLRQSMQSYSSDEDDPAESGEESHDFQRSLHIGSRDVLGANFPDSEELELAAIRKYLLNHADGVILWVVLVLAELKREVSNEFFSFQDLRAKLVRLPTRLDSLYSHIVERLCRKHDDTRIEKARRILMWVTYARRPLTLDEFREAIAIPLELEEDGGTQAAQVLANSEDPIAVNRVRGSWKQFERGVTELCGCFIETVPDLSRPSVFSQGTRVIKATDTVQLLHQTVKDFLCHPRSQPFYMPADRSQNTIDQATLRYLELTFPPVSTSYFKIESTEEWRENDYIDFLRYLENKPFVNYALRHVDLSRTHDFLSTACRNPQTQTWSLLQFWAKNNCGLDVTASRADLKFCTRCVDVARKCGFTGVVGLIFILFLDPPRRRSEFGGA